MAQTAFPELNQYQEQSALEKKEEMESKINFFTQQAERFGEMGNILESEKMMEEAEKTKRDLESLRNATENPFLFGKDKNMKVCEVCGALQAESDADKKLSMHLEGKLHTGYAKVRTKLKDLVLKREEHKRQKKLL